MSHSKSDHPSVAGKILIFAPSDADSEFLALQRELAAFSDDLENRDVEPLKVFEGTQVPKDETVLEPEVAETLRSRYGVPRGKLTLLALSAADQQPVSRVVGSVSSLELREAIAAISTPAS